MRITNNMLGNNLLRNLESAQGRMDSLQNQMSSGYKITRPSDDPVGIENALRTKSTISSVNQWKSNADEALSTMYTEDAILGDMTSLLQRARELTVQGASDTVDASSRKSIALEVDQMAEQLRASANTKIGNKYIFGGTRTNAEPMPDLVNGWQGNEEFIKFEVGNNLNLPISINGKKLFEGMFQTMNNLSAALKANDGAAVSGTLGDLDNQIDNVSAQRAELGARTNRMDALRQQLDATSLNLQQNLAEIQEADMAELIVQYQNQENVYRAALSIGAKIIQPSLVDFMR